MFIYYFWLFSSCGEQEILSGCSVSASHCSGFLSPWLLLLWSMGSRVHALQQLQRMSSAVAGPGLQSTGSVAVEHGLSYMTACETFLDQRLNPCLLHRQVDSLPLDHQGSPVSLNVITLTPNTPHRCTQNNDSPTIRASCDSVSWHRRLTITNTLSSQALYSNS